MQIDAVEAILQLIDPGWGEFNVSRLRDGEMFLQHTYERPDAHTGVPGVGKGRKWHVSAYATPSEVVATAFKAVITNSEHEIREKFLYCGEAVFGPHLDVAQMATYLRNNRDTATEVRQPMEKP